VVKNFAIFQIVSKGRAVVVSFPLAFDKVSLELARFRENQQALSGAEAVRLPCDAMW
jgi:hypothetical protein